METIKYKITFFTEWHAGSGLTSGSDLDALVIKDKNDMPYIPGRTLKGLLKEAALQLCDLGYCKKEFIAKVFGVATDTQKDKEDMFFDLEEEKATIQGGCFFENAILPAEIYTASIQNKLAPFYYRSIASTAIKAESGVAKQHSLRRMQTTIPCTMDAEITNIDKAYFEQIELCMKWIKRMGQNRNRGLGRCQFEIIKSGEGLQ